MTVSEGFARRTAARSQSTTAKPPIPTKPPTPEERFTALVEGASDIIYEADTIGRFTFVNPAVRSTLGYSAEELIGRHFSELVREEWRERVIAHYNEQARTAAATTSLEFPVVAADGSTIWISQTVEAVIWEDCVVGYRAIARDVTERVVAEERFNAFMNNSPTVAFMKAADGRYVYANELMKRLFASGDQQILGLTDDDLVPSELAAKIRNNDADVLERRQSIQVVEAAPTNEGEVRQWLTCKFPVAAQDGSLYVGGVAVDLTERLALENELAKARDAALASVRQKSQFLANMSHEIRTPMNGILGLLGILADSRLDDDQRDLVQTARASAELLLTIINDILDFSKIEAGKLDFEVLDFDVREVCESTLDLMAESVRRKSLEIGLVIDPEIPAVLRGDPGRLRQVLLNLMSNAVKFTESGGVLLHVERGGEDGDRVELRFRITDTGIGMTSETRDRLFRPFVQSDASTTRRFGGTGLGLAISKQLVQMMDGDIGVESEPGCGSTFWFTGHFGCVETKTAVIATRGERVLVVEDSATTRQTIALQLSAWKASCDIADDGLAALKMLRDACAAGSPYSVVISDLNMPGIDGVALARLAKSGEFGSPRVILITAGTQAFDAGRFAELGVTACLRKPVKPAHLFSAVFARPVRTRAAGRAISAPAAPLRGTRRVLVADDNAINQKVAVRQLQKMGIAAEAVGNGAEALEALDRIAYDLVLMDCQMPEMDGYDATAALREREQASGHRTPVIALTASALESDRELCRAAGMDDFLSKPVREHDLAEVLRRWLPAPAEERGIA